MKQPRASDFDPSAKERELKSSMDDFPAIEQPRQMLLPDRLPATVSPVQNIPSADLSRRKIKPRHAFDIYEDQVEMLKQLALEDRMRGGTGSMSAMVREAIDDHLAKVRQLRGD